MYLEFVLWSFYLIMHLITFIVVTVLDVLISLVGGFLSVVFVILICLC